jgi:hypothetical protein
VKCIYKQNKMDKPISSENKFTTPKKVQFAVEATIINAPKKQIVMNNQLYRLSNARRILFTYD